MVRYVEIALFVLLCYLLFVTRDILFILYVSLLLALATNPFIDRLEKFKLPRGLSIMLVYVLFWGLFALVIALITPPLVAQTRHLISLLPSSLSEIEIFKDYQSEISKEILSRISFLPQAVIGLLVGIFSNIFTVFTTLVITFYLLSQRKNIPDLLGNLPFVKSKKMVSDILIRVETQLGFWMVGELTLMLAVGTMTYIGLKILGVEVALPLAIIAGILELIPNIGPTISAIPAILVALTIHPFLAVSTTALYFLVQFIENNFLVPKIMLKAVGVNPIFSILGLMIGFRLAGPLGAILAIPTILIIETIYLELKK